MAVMKSPMRFPLRFTTQQPGPLVIWRTTGPCDTANNCSAYRTWPAVGVVIDRPIKVLTMYQKILVPLDGSPTAEHGLRLAIDLAADQKEKARLTLLHVVDDFSMLVEMSAVLNYQEMLKGLRRYGEELLSRAKAVAQAQGVEADTIIREVTQARIADVILEEVKSASCDLIVMGTHGRRGVSRITMGSDAEQVVRMSPVPVLLVRHEDAKSADVLTKIQRTAGEFARSGAPIQ